jgi:hypothetical protein
MNKITLYEVLIPYPGDRAVDTEITSPVPAILLMVVSR